VQCPSADGLDYRAPGVPNKVFRRICSYDFPMSDLFNLTATNMEDCINACAARSGCAGVTWNYDGLQGTDVHYCWVKGALGTKFANANVESAVLLQW